MAAYTSQGRQYRRLPGRGFLRRGQVPGKESTSIRRIVDQNSNPTTGADTSRWDGGGGVANGSNTAGSPSGVARRHKSPMPWRILTTNCSARVVNNQASFLSIPPSGSDPVARLSIGVHSGPARCLGHTAAGKSARCTRRLRPGTVGAGRFGGCKCLFGGRRSGESVNGETHFGLAAYVPSAHQQLSTLHCTDDIAEAIGRADLAGQIDVVDALMSFNGQLLFSIKTDRAVQRRGDLSIGIRAGKCAASQRSGIFESRWTSMGHYNFGNTTGQIDGLEAGRHSRAGDSGDSIDASGLGFQVEIPASDRGGDAVFIISETCGSWEMETNMNKRRARRL